MPVREIRVNRRQLAQLVKRLDEVPKLLKQIGAMLVSDSRKAFSDQQFGSIVWEKKYGGAEKHEGPFVSPAGIVQDFGVGDRTAPLTETLVDSPALFRTGQLSQNISSHPVGVDEVEIGSAVPYATLHQQGGVSTQDVTQEVKDRLADWLRGETKTRTEVEGEFTKSGRPKTKTVKTPNSVYRKRLGFLLNPKLTTLETDVMRRPFIGITERRSEIIAEMLQDFMAGESDGEQ